MTIHWFDSLTKRNIAMGRLTTTMAAKSSTTFFQNVCQLVSTMASPKQPQSLMGSVSANQSVSGVITIRMARMALDVNRLRMANSRKMPRQNSVADSATESPSVTRSGNHWPMPHAVR